MKNTTRYIPKNSAKVADKLSDAIAYIYTDPKRDRPCALIYYGKQSKAVAHHGYKSECEREKSVAGYFASRQAHDRLQAESKAKRLAPNLLQVGDILSCSWGYDQTNVDFYEVVGVSGQYVDIRSIAQRSEDTGNMTGTCLPRPGRYLGKADRKLVQYGDSVTISSYSSARKWDGRPLRWSSYA